VCIVWLLYVWFVCVLYVPSVLWYCWLGLLTCKNRLSYNLYCVGGYIKHCSIQSKRCVLEQKLLLTAYRKSYMRNGLVPKMHDLDLCLEVVSRSCQPLRHIRHWISRKPLELESCFERNINGKWSMAIKWSHERWRHVTPKGQTRDSNILRAQYLENG